MLRMYPATLACNSTFWYGMNWPAIESEVAIVSRFTGATAACGVWSLSALVPLVLLPAGEPARARLARRAATRRQTTTRPNTRNLCQRRTCMNFLFSTGGLAGPDTAQRELFSG